MPSSGRGSTMTTKTFNILLQLDSHNGTNTLQTQTQQCYTLTTHKLTTHMSYDIQRRPYNMKIL